MTDRDRLRAAQVRRLKDLFVLRRADAVGREAVRQTARLCRLEWQAFRNLKEEAND